MKLSLIYVDYSLICCGPSRGVSHRSFRFLNFVKNFAKNDELI